MIWGERSWAHSLEALRLDQRRSFLPDTQRIGGTRKDRIAPESYTDSNKEERRRSTVDDGLVLGR